MSVRNRRLLFIVVFFLISAAWISAYPSSVRFPVPENYEVRFRYRDLIFGPRNEILDFGQIVESQSGFEATVSMQILSQNDSFYLVFTNEEEGEYPLYSSGSYVIKRDYENGNFTQIKVFIRSEPGSFVRIHPAGKRSTMDVYLFDRLLYRQVVLPMPIERIALEPFSRIVELSNSQVAWELLSPLSQRPGDGAVQAMVESLRTEIVHLADSDDGAMDLDGVYRYIDTLAIKPTGGLNCSGFSKWVVDGLYQKKTGLLLSIESLKEKHIGFRGNAWSENYEDDRDPYFGLDWSRNLATMMLSLNTGRDAGPEDADVRSVPFFEYIEDVGYRAADLELVLYFLSRTEPGTVYIGSVNRDFGVDPVLKQHVHIALFFPYFDGDGIFRIAVMERNRETSMQSIEDRYSGDHIHLVRVSVSDGYSPPTLNFTND